MAPSTDRVPLAMQTRYDEIVAMTDAVCAQHLSDEYCQLCRQMTAALCRKRPSPLASGPARSWACGIAYALGRVNWLFDKSQSPHMRAFDLCQQFALSSNTGAAKSSQIIRALKINMGDRDWTLPSKLANHPLAWMVQVNGSIVDARRMPRDFQQAAFERGLIPFMPDQAPADAPDREHSI